MKNKGVKFKFRTRTGLDDLRALQLNRPRYTGDSVSRESLHK